MVWLSTVSDRITGGLRGFFYWLGENIASNPWGVIICMLAVSAVSCFGLLKYNEHLPGDESPWIPGDHPYIKRLGWVNENIDLGERLQSVLFVPPPGTYLTATYNYLFLEFDRRIRAVNASRDDIKYLTICHTFAINVQKEECRYLYFSPQGSIKTGASILLTSHKDKEVRGSRMNILTKGPSNVKWKNTFSDAFLSSSEYGSGTDKLEQEFAWEADLENLKDKTEACVGSSQECSILDKTDVFIFTSSGIFRDSADSMKSDTKLIIAGYLLIILYASMCFGRFNCVEHKIMLGVATVLSVIISLVVAVSLGSLMGVHMGVLNTLLTYLILGIGVDDSFVIISALDNVNRDQPGLDLKTKMATALSHAGVSITVTSMTDLVAFVISAFSAMPVMQSFCTYAALATVVLFVMQAVFFTACLTIDESRRMQKRNAIFCCYKKDDYKPPSWSKKDIQAAIFEHAIGPALMKPFLKFIVCFIAAGLLGVCVYGTVHLEFDGDREQGLPESSASKKYMLALRKLSPISIPASIYFKEGFDYYRRGKTVENLITGAKKIEGIVNDSFLDWYTAPHKLSLGKRNIEERERIETFSMREQHEYEYYGNMSRLLFTHPFMKSSLGVSVFLDNSSYVRSRDTMDYLRRRRITKSSIQFSVAGAFSDKAWSAFANSLDTVTEKECPEGECFAFGNFFVWAASVEVVQEELFRNVFVAFGCVLVMMFILLANALGCLIVTVTVVLTVVNTMGMMFFLGIKLDIVANILIVMSVGFAVDFSAHVGHAFLCSTGTRNERAITSLKNLGPAVFNGGFSTFLVFFPVAFTASPVFFLFFEILALCMGFGLWNGLIVLPVLFSLIGPAPYSFTEKEQRTNGVATSAEIDREWRKTTGRTDGGQVSNNQSNHMVTPNGFSDESRSHRNDLQTISGLYLNTNIYDPDVHEDNIVTSNQRFFAANNHDNCITTSRGVMHPVDRPNIHPEEYDASAEFNFRTSNGFNTGSTIVATNYVR